MKRTNIYHPIGPVGSIIIGLVICALHLAQILPLGWVGLALVLGGAIMLMVRIMNQNKDQTPQ